MKITEELKPCPCCGIDDEVGIVFRNGRSYVYCDKCNMDGPEGDNDDAAVAAWNALPRRLKFTKEKPKEGWYWLRKAGKKPEVVNVDRGRYVMGYSYGAPLSDEMFDDVEWAGPIPEPEDAEQ